MILMNLALFVTSNFSAESHEPIVLDIWDIIIVMANGHCRATDGHYVRLTAIII